MGFIQKYFKLILLIVILGLCLYTTVLYLTVGQRGYDTVLPDLSQRFLEGKVSMSVHKLPPRDISNYYENYYVYFGPLSSLMLMPIVLLFGDKTPQVLVGVFSMTVSFISVYFIALKFKFSRIDSLWLSLFFVFSTVLFSSSVINITAYQVEALGVPFILLSICAYLYKRNAFLIGLCVGLALLTRFTLMLAVSFFIFEVIQKRFTVRQFIIFLIPVILAIGLLGAYNERRFHSVLETGYKYNISKASDGLSKNHKYGEINVLHLPGNLFSFLIMAPEPLFMDGKDGFILRFPYMKANPWGVAIWFTSPLFLLLVLRFKKGIYTVSSVIASVLLSVPVFFWYSIGYAQFGYRYVLDFLPFLFLLLLPCLTPKLSKIAIALIIIGIVFNLIYSVSMWEMYPLFNIYPKIN